MLVEKNGVHGHQKNICNKVGAIECAPPVSESSDVKKSEFITTLNCELFNANKRGARIEPN